MIDLTGGYFNLKERLIMFLVPKLLNDFGFSPFSKVWSN